MSVSVNNRQRFLFWSSPLLLLNCFSGIKTHAQCINLSGQILNSKNKQPIEASIQIRANGQKQDLGQSQANGQFNIEMPCKAQSLILSKKDFRITEIPVYAQADSGSYYIQISMVPLDKEIVNKPYAQTEQSEIVLENTGNTKEKTAKRVFKVTDAISNQSLISKVCLFFTKSGDKQCFNTTKELSDKIVFKEEDIIAIEVEANGYQNYKGNIIVELDNKTSVYEIAMSKIPVLISGQINLVSGNSLQQLNLWDSNKQRIKIKQKDNLFYTPVNETGKYSFQIISSNETFEKNQDLRAGLNFFLFNEPGKKLPAPKKDSLSKPDVGANYSKRNEIDLIYFEQSDFALTKLAKQQLDSIFVYLTNRTSIDVKIIGHTDNVGDPRINEALGEYRAKVIYTYLLKAGINSKRMSWVSYGSSHPVSPNDNEDNKKKNRRVEIVYKSN